MPQIVDRIDFACTDVDPSQWPKLSCGGANQLRLESGGLRVEANRELLFEDNGQIRSFDNNHKLVFNRTGNLLELHEAGDIRFLTGAPAPTEKLRIRTDGNVGIGTDAPSARLHVAGDMRTDGNLRVTGNVEISGNLTVAGIIQGALAANAIGTTQLANGAVTTAKIADKAVTVGKIADGVLPPAIGIVVQTGMQHGQSIPVPSGFTREECVFFVAFKYLLVEPSNGRTIYNCAADSKGKVSITPDGSAVAVGVALAKKGGW